MSTNNGIPTWAWLSALGGLFTSLWGIIWGMQSRRISKIEEETAKKLSKKTDRMLCEQREKSMNLWLESHGKTLEEMSSSITQGFISENKLTLEKISELKNGQIENKGLIKNVERKLERMNENFIAEKIKSATHQSWVETKFKENDEYKKKVEKDIEDVKKSYFYNGNLAKKYVESGK